MTLTVQDVKNIPAVFSAAVFIQEIGGNNPVIPIGNASSLSVASALNTDDQPNYTDPVGGLESSTSKVSNVTVTITALSINQAVLKPALATNVTKGSNTPIVAEEHQSFSNGVIITKSNLDTTQTIIITDSGAVTTFNKDTDYTISHGFITITGADEGGTIPNDSVIEVSYTPKKTTQYQPLTDITKQYRVIAVGTNAAADGTRYNLELYRCRFQPTTGIDFISQTHIPIELTASVLADPTKTGVGNSQYLKLTIDE